jgi:hypothetical protein
MTQAFLLGPLVLTALVRTLATEGTEGNLYKIDPRGDSERLVRSLATSEGSPGRKLNGKLLVMRGDRLMVHTSLWCGLYAAFAWREEGPIAA